MIEIIMFLLGITIIVWGTERFTEGLIGSAVISGVSTFTLGIIFGGFDAENLGTGIIAALKGLPGISLGTVIGSSIFLSRQRSVPRPFWCLLKSACLGGTFI